MYRKFPLFKQDIRYVFGSRWKSPEGLEILENKIIPPPKKKHRKEGVLDVVLTIIQVPIFDNTIHCKPTFICHNLILVIKPYPYSGCYLQPYFLALE